eukprot:TRINITY_DN49656_c0_g1_i1.p1 TRINITY_DN49656_c0_g1~~TRINITY_DN49656_c0_g1_i1.p1  ORF type:complete len:376 (+),score=41.87 TRINITY_DN49656_c0_g1_i1:40-1167(+)
MDVRWCRSHLIFAFLLHAIVLGRSKRNTRRNFASFLSLQDGAPSSAILHERHNFTQKALSQQPESDAHKELLKPPLVFDNALRPNATFWDRLKLVCFALGDGMGLTLNSRSERLSSVPKYMEVVETFQQVGFVCLVLVAYLSFLLFAACILYNDSKCSGAVKLYTDHCIEDLHSESYDAQDFVDAFCRPPMRSLLTVIGTLDVDMGGYTRKRDVFNFALDISPWITCESREFNEIDHGKVMSFLREDGNSLARLKVLKRVEWNDWEELAMNIKLKIKQNGFPGVVVVQRDMQSEISVYKNTQWANFMRNRSLKAVAIFSIVAAFVYFPYLAFRSAFTVVRLNYRIDVPIKTFWPLIEEGLCQRGFINRDDEIAFY